MFQLWRNYEFPGLHPILPARVRRASSYPKPFSQFLAFFGLVGHPADVTARHVAEKGERCPVPLGQYDQEGHAIAIPTSKGHS